MADTLDPLDEVNTYTGQTPNQSLAPAAGAPAPSPDQSYTRVASKEEYDALPHNARYVDPEGNVRNKAAYQVTDEASYHDVPEKGLYIDPEGNERTKPEYQPLSYSAQTMYSMAVTPKEKRKVLEKFYPGMVQGDGENLLVDDDGTLRAPGKMNSVPSAAGMVAGNLAPIAGGAAGGILGAASGGLPAAGGAALGTMGGQYFNDIILKLNGLYDRTAGEEFTDKAIGAGTSLAGDVAGRAIAGFVPSVKAGVSNVGNALPKMANKFLGTNADDVTRFRSVAEMGEKPSSSATLRGLGITETDTAPGISTIAKESPHLQNVQEVFHEAFDTSQPRQRAAEAAYNKMAAPLMEAQGIGQAPKIPDSIIGAFPDMRPASGGGISLNGFTTEERQALQNAGLVKDFTTEEGVAYKGVNPEDLWAIREARQKEYFGGSAGATVDDLVSPTPTVSVQETGEKIIRKALEQSGEIDARLAAELANRKAALEAGVAEMPAQREALMKAAQAQRENATQLVNAGIAEVERNADAAVQAAAQGTNSGDLWHAVGTQLQEVRRAIGERFRAQAQIAYDAVPRGATIRTAPLVNEAQDFLARMPPEFEARNPQLVRRIRDLGERPNPDFDPAVGGSQYLPPPSLPLSEIHQMRSDLRSAADWYDLPSDFKNGSLKYFSHQVDNLIQGAGTTPQFSTAVRLLNENDRWYAQEIPVFNARELKTVLRGLESGEPADPATLFKAIVQPGNKELIARTEQVVGPNLWNGVRGAQRQQWLQNARKGQFDGSVDAVKYAEEVLEANRLGTLHAVQGREAGDALLQQAQQIAALHGDLPVTFRPNDTAFDVFRQARTAAEAAERESVTDPLKVLARETRKVEGQARAQAAASKRADPLSFLSNQSFGATRAVNKILGDEDLILASAARFGEHSPEFDALRQVWTERVFRGTLEPGKRLEKISPEVQRLMLGVNLETAQKLAEDMAFIMGGKAMQRGDMAGGMAAMSKVEHPIAGKTISRAARLVPGANTAARATLGAYYSFMNKVLESPATARWLEKAYTGGEAHRNMVREELARIVGRGGAIGAGAAQGAYQLGND